MSVSSHKRSNRGFTLIELLVVISIIAVLISILLPALSSAVEQGRKIKCQANMRDITQTAQTYANDDPKGIMGAVHPEAVNFIYEGYSDYGGGPGTMRFTGWKEEFDPRTRPLNHILYGAGGIVQNTAPGDRGVYQQFQCPGDDRGWQVWNGFDSHDFETEPNPYYKGNGTAFRQNNLQTIEGQIVGIYGRPTNRIPDTSQVLAFTEARAFQTLFTNNVWGQLEPGELISYHKKLGFFNVTYCDGHAAFADFGDDTYYQSLIQYNLEDARGSWGRFDCFPEPMITEF